MASSNVSAVKQIKTGPKISSWYTFMLGVTSVRMVGPTKLPFSKPSTCAQVRAKPNDSDHLNTSSIQHQLRTLVDSTLDELFDSLFGLRGNQRSKIHARLVSLTDLELLGSFDDLRNPEDDSIYLFAVQYHSLVSPTKTAAEIAIQRCPDAPKAAPTIWSIVLFLSASGMMVA